MSLKYEQPLDLAYAPPRYPAHAYSGDGIIVVVRLGSAVVGHLTRQGDAVGWDGAWPPEADESVISDEIIPRLREGAASGAPLDETWLAILRDVQHDAYLYAPLDGLQGSPPA